MTISEHIRDFKTQLKQDWPAVTIIVSIILVATIMNTSSLITENTRNGNMLPWYNPFLGEASSGFASIILSLLVIRILHFHPYDTKKLKYLIPIYFATATTFSFLHVSIMVGIRKIFWPILFDSNYHFYGDIIQESLYEYRKDLGTFAMFLLVFTLVRAARETKAPQQDPITLKCGSTTLILQPDDFLYAKGAGNYAEIETTEGQKLARITLTDLEKALNEAHCDAIRIHRSLIVNRATISETNPIPGGDISLTLKNGHQLRASRRYKSALKLDVN